MVDLIDTPFGPIQCIVADWMPPDQLILFTPGEKTVITDEQGNVLREVWTRKPSMVITKNVGVTK